LFVSVGTNELGGGKMAIHGLTAAEVSASRKKYGENIIPMPAPKSVWYFFAQVFKDKINLILLIMLGLFAVLAVSGYGEYYEVAGIGFVLTIISVISVVTQLRAQRDARALQRAAGRHFCRVLRDGGLHLVESSDIVVGDIVLLSAGETVCADGYIIDGTVSVNNAILNGESEECEKKPVPGYKYDRRHRVSASDYTDMNSVFAGTTVMDGRAHMRVARVGVDTQNAQIMTSLHDIDTVRTSLQIQIDVIADKIGRVGSVCAVAVCTVLVAVMYFDGSLGTGAAALHGILKSATIALTIFVAAVPEGLPFIISIITGRNMVRMTRAHILPKNPQKIPAAGNLHIICTDKTGTLTLGVMTVVANFIGDGTDGDDLCGTAMGEIFAQNCVLNNGASYDDAGAVIGGNSTDRAILAVIPAAKASDIQSKSEIIRQVVFNSSNKFAMTVAKIPGYRGPVTLVRGAPEVVLKNCSQYVDSHGRLHKFDNARMDDIMRHACGRSMRMVASAYYVGAAKGDSLPSEMVLICVTAMRDEIRPDVPSVVGMLDRAGIQTIMITGDNIDTARAIARECGILTHPDDIAISAEVLDSRTDEWICQNLSKIRVIARATPASKLRIVKLAQSLNKSIGMCGDGTNDAPALRRADVGFSMGDGTDVCKEAGDIIITDNNFVSVANSVLIGRTFLHNIVSFLRFQLPINFCLVALCVIYPLLFGGEVISAVQILIINIVMDSMNSLSFGGEPPRPEYMTYPAPAKNSSLLSKGVLAQIAVSTIMFVTIFSIILTPPVRALFPDADSYMGARFALLVIMSMLNGFNIRTAGYNLFSGLRENPMFIYVAVIVIAGCVACVSFGGAALQTAPLSVGQWAVVFALAALIVPMDMARKFIMRRIRAR